MGIDKNIVSGAVDNDDNTDDDRDNYVEFGNDQTTTMTKRTMKIRKQGEKDDNKDDDKFVIECRGW